MAKIRAVATSSSQIDRINRFKGINVSVDPTQLEYNESPDMLNMTLDTEGALDKRTGYAKLFETALGAKVHTIAKYRKSDGTTVNLLHAGTKLYTFLLDGTQPTEIHTGLADAKSQMFTFNDKLYIIDGTNYLEYDGTTVAEPTPYVPTLFISTPPSGGGTAYEDFNLIGSGFKQTFSGDGTATEFQIALTELDADTVLAKVDEVDKTEGVDFTVDRTLGTVTFTVAPSTGTPNNVEITAYKTVAGLKDKITQCKYFKLYGGTNDTRIFLWGSDNNTLYRSDVYRANYFPENAFQRVGSDSTKILAMSQQYDTAIIHKENSLWFMSYSQDDSGVSIFPVKTINSTVGVLAAESVQIIENNPCMLNSRGVYVLTQSNVRDERNVQHISNRIDALLLAETDLQNAVTVDYDKKYMIALNSNVYVWDYRLNEWYPWDNVPATCFLEIDGRLYFGDELGNVYYFKKKTDASQIYRDVNQPINAYWKSRALDFGYGERYKTVKRTFITIKPGIRTGAKLYYIDNQRSQTQIDEVNMSKFTYSNFSYRKFSYILSDHPQVSPARPKIKKITHFQFMFENNVIDESLGVIGIQIEYEIMGFMKG